MCLSTRIAADWTAALSVFLTRWKRGKHTRLIVDPTAFLLRAALLYLWVARVCRLHVMKDSTASCSCFSEPNTSIKSVVGRRREQAPSFRWRNLTCLTCWTYCPIRPHRRLFLISQYKKQQAAELMLQMWAVVSLVNTPTSSASREDELGGRHGDPPPTTRPVL